MFLKTLNLGVKNVVLTCKMCMYLWAIYGYIFQAICV